MFVVHTSNCHGQNCTRRAMYRLRIDTLSANILVIFVTLSTTSDEEYFNVLLFFLGKI